MGDLQKVLDKGEYIPLKYAPVFESNFVQVNSRGESIYLHNRPNYVTMGICASSRNLSLPNVMLLAHVSPASSQEDISAEQMCTRQSCSEDELVITRFLPLKFVDLSVYNAKKRHFKLTLVNGRAYYLELCAPPHKQSQLFRQWVRLISVLKSKSKYSAVNALYKDFNTPDENRAIRSKQAKVEPPTSEQTSQESVRPPIIKKASSKRVTISEIMDPSEGSLKSQSQTPVSSYSCMKKPTVDLEKQSNYSKASLTRTFSISKSRERGSFSNSEKKIQTAGILKNVS